jgi:hypothetical protein
MGSARGGVGVVALLSLLVVLGYAATALGLPTRGAKTPLTRPELKEVEARVNYAILEERKALVDIGRPDFGATAQFHLGIVFSPLDTAKETLADHDLGRYGSALTDVQAAVEHDHSADKALEVDNHKLALADVALALKEKKKAISALSDLSAYGPIAETTPTEASLEACAFVASRNATSSTLAVKVVDAGQAGASGTVTIAGLVTPPLTGTFKLNSTGTALSQFVVTAVGDASIIMDLSTLTGQTQTLPFTFALTTSTPLATDCAPHK